eukprot:TRINITY_DN3138_c0_g1_i1.p1 TRINITY_DN3138_c0_g1~~TRINITY_DN3138_c0_g1_i1.p1  ORF type:complete len:302 (+),score=52.24 TRINITY_DN3138_c0_g1_i1:103-1008(+)
MLWRCVAICLCLQIVAGALYHGEPAEKGKLQVSDLPEYQHRFRLCNAYPSAKKLSMVLVKKSESKADEKKDDKKKKRMLYEAPKFKPFAYKECQDFRIKLQVGDSFEFTHGDKAILPGVFNVKELPSSDTVMMLIVKRSSTQTPDISFSSHLYSDVAGGTQMAVLDVYTGPKEAIPQISVAQSKDGKESNREKLKFDYSVAVNPGTYKVELVDKKKGEVQDQHEFHAIKGESYVVLRVGNELKSKTVTEKAYPQEVVIYPLYKVEDAPTVRIHDEPEAPKSAAADSSIAWTLLMMITLSLM